jgi:hypothetical protein
MITEALATLLIILSYFVGFVVGLFVGVSFSKYRRDKPRKALHAGLAAADGKRHDGRERSIIALVIVSGVIVFDHFKGPLFPDVFYCLYDGGAQITRMCTGRVPPN